MRTKSKNPKKQRKYQFNTDKNEVHKVMSSNLSSDLREQKGFRSLPIRVGDTVAITRGSEKGRSGKIIRVNLKKQRVFVDKVVKRKTDNTEVPMPIHPSNLVITKYYGKDRRRLEIINRRIKDIEEKIDIETSLAVATAEEEDEDIIEIDDEELTDPDMESDDTELFDENEEEIETGEDDI